jgi:hypothetical protein
MDLLLHLHKGQITIMAMMTHQLGVITGVGIDLHLGQKPKLGGEVCQRLTHLHIIFCRYFVYPWFAFLLFVVLVLISTFQNTKRPKIFPLFLFVCLFSFLVWFALFSIFGLVFKKSKKILLCLLFPSILVSIFENSKIFVVLFRFCKVCCRVQSPMTPLELGYHFIFFKPHK